MGSPDGALESGHVNAPVLGQALPGVLGQAPVLPGIGHAVLPPVGKKEGEEEEEEDEDKEVKDAIEEQVDELENIEATDGFGDGASAKLENAQPFVHQTVGQSIMEVVSISINFMQMFSLVTFIDIAWPVSFKMIFSWVDFFTFTWIGFNFGISSEAPSILIGLSLFPVLILTGASSERRGAKRRCCMNNSSFATNLAHHCRFARRCPFPVANTVLTS